VRQNFAAGWWHFVRSFFLRGGLTSGEAVVAGVIDAEQVTLSCHAIETLEFFGGHFFNVHVSSPFLLLLIAWEGVALFAQLRDLALHLKNKVAQVVGTLPSSHRRWTVVWGCTTTTL
jgi:hypothetical protein